MCVREIKRMHGEGKKGANMCEKCMHRVEFGTLCNVLQFTYLSCIVYYVLCIMYRNILTQNIQKHPPTLPNHHVLHRPCPYQISTFHHHHVPHPEPCFPTAYVKIVMYHYFSSNSSIISRFLKQPPKFSQRAVCHTSWTHFLIKSQLLRHLVQVINNKLLEVVTSP